mmetsp:Transcript_9247/g.14294  ORF Transcript_9247/g.14294 Transcript_9247/m.14294 type:complete len:428 (+) Transcript_9247:29-1312(+)
MVNVQSCMAKCLSHALLVLPILFSCINCFVQPSSTHFTGNSLNNVFIRPLSQSESVSVLRASVDDKTSFSKKRESPLGVRRRVKAVLNKARSRTGIKNLSDDDSIIKEPTATSILAESISIGGLSFENGTSVSLEYKQRNGYQDVKDPASTSSPVVKSKVEPDEVFVVANGAATKKKNGVSSNAELIAINADVPAAYAEPLPFTLPRLSAEQKRLLRLGERIQEQSKMGRDGSGYVVVDVNVPPYVVWECLLDFESYPELIPTVRDVQFFSSENLKSGYYAEKPIDPSTGRELRHYGSPSTTRAAFILSKFRLNIAAIHNYRPHPEGHYMDFSLDPECTNMVLKSAKGIWHTQANPEGRGQDWTRVYLICELKVSRVLPAFIVDYAAKRAMPRATSWLKPQVETASKLWLNNGPFPQTQIKRKVNGD